MKLYTVRKDKVKKEQVDYAAVELYQKNEHIFKMTDRIAVSECTNGDKKISITIGGIFLFDGSKKELEEILKENLKKK